MPKIINAYADGQNSIADSLKSIGTSIWGDEAKNEGLRQNAEKLRRENAGREAAADAFTRGDYAGIGAGGIRGGMSGGDAGAYSRLLAARNSKGNYDDPTLGTMMLGSGEAMSSTPEGQRRAMSNQRAMEQDRTDASKYTPIMNEDPRTGVKSPAGAFDTKTGRYQPFGQPSFGAPIAPTPRGAPAPGGGPQVGYQPTAAYNMPAGEPTGGDYLQTLDPGHAAVIAGILDGRVAPPTGNAVFSRRNQVLLDDMARVEPGFDMTKWVERYKTSQDFSSAGKSGQAVKSANQAITHLGRLTENADSLHNYENIGHGIPLVGGLIGGGTQTLNSMKNANATASGEVGTGPFELSRNAFADEIAKVFRTTGMSDHEIAQWHNTINSSQSPTQLRANIGEALRLYHGATDALEQARTRGMGTFRQQPPLLDPATVDTMHRIEGWTKGGKYEPAPAPTGPQPATALPAGPNGHPPSFNDRFEGAQGAQPPAPGAAAPQAPPAAPRRAKNAQGHVIEWNGQTWVPAQ